jgi:hypothetical protein
VLGDDEVTKTNGTDHEEASCDADVVMLGVVIPNALTPCVVQGQDTIVGPLN